jgi:hypothetical protein
MNTIEQQKGFVENMLNSSTIKNNEKLLKMWKSLLSSILIVKDMKKQATINGRSEYKVLVEMSERNFMEYSQWLIDKDKI